MKTKVPLIAVLTTVACVLATSAVAKPASTAYFKVKFHAKQSILWTMDQTSTTCGVSHTTGHGLSQMQVTSGDWQPMTVKRVGTSVAFRFDDGKSPDMGVTGTIKRNGEMSGSGGNPKDPRCGTPIPIAPDCGERAYPGGTRVALEWNTPANWPFGDGPKPHEPSLHIRGPYGPGLQGRAMYQNCPGERDDYLMGVNGSQGYDAGHYPLSLSKLFGKKAKHFTINGGIADPIPHVTQPGITGGVTSDLALRWWVEFKRLPHAPRH
jgi:hypothetical protein